MTNTLPSGIAAVAWASAAASQRVGINRKACMSLPVELLAARTGQHAARHHAPCWNEVREGTPAGLNTQALRVDIRTAYGHLLVITSL